jgi:hypothetical protein
MHHLACTGGTLLSRYVASMKDVTLLSEVNPAAPQSHYFNPLDPIAVMSHKSSVINAAFTEAEQLRRYKICVDVAKQMNTKIVFRDHSHTDYSFGTIKRRSLLTLLQKLDKKIASLVTVRNPIDSWYGLIAANFPRVESFQDYCERYNVFLDDYADLPVVKYEDFVAVPQRSGQQICSALSLPYLDDFESLHAVTLTGNSGRGQLMNEIRKLDRRPLTKAQSGPMYKTKAVTDLFDRLSYDWDL